MSQEEEIVLQPLTIGKAGKLYEATHRMIILRGRLNIEFHEAWRKVKEALEVDYIKEEIKKRRMGFKEEIKKEIKKRKARRWRKENPGYQKQWRSRNPDYEKDRYHKKVREEVAKKLKKSG